MERGIRRLDHTTVIGRADQSLRLDWSAFGQKNWGQTILRRGSDPNFFGGEGESLFRISKDPRMPNQRTLSDWVAKNHLGFAERYLEAKRIAAHFLAERALEECL